MIVTSNGRKSVYLVDNDRISRGQLSRFLRSEGFSAHPCSTGGELLAGLEYLNPGCVLVDVEVPDAAGLDIIAALIQYRARLPIIAMSRAGSVATAVAAMKAGAVDVIEKPIDRTLLLRTLDVVFTGLDAQVREDERRSSASERLASLTARERDVLLGLTAGRSNKLLAYDFGISIRTVEMHRSSMMDRLGVRTLAEALRIAFVCGAQVNATFNRRAA